MEASFQKAKVADATGLNELVHPKKENDVV
jgi:hypothetical protein